MKMNNIHHTLLALLLAAIAAITCSCERELDFNVGSTDRELTVYAVANAGAPFKAYVTRSFSTNRSPNFYQVLETRDDMLRRVYLSTMVVKDAQVTAVVNGTDRYEMTYDTTTTAYGCAYVPRVGDKVEFTAKAQGFDDATATTTVLAPIEIHDLQYEIVPDQAVDPSIRDTHPGDTWRDLYGADTVMRATFTFHDPGGEKNYYRMRVRNIGEAEELPGMVKYSVGDVFKSDSPVFFDRSLPVGYGLWDKNFSDVFDDHLIDGQDCTITVSGRKRSWSKRRMIVELQSISPEMYYFLKSLMVYRISVDDVYSTPVQIYSGITNGWGVLGSVSGIPHTIEYGD